MKKLISIITPTYNRGETFLAPMIESVQKQIEHGFSHEHIIVDNASTDNTRKIVKAFAKKDPRIIYVRSPKNVKASGALNIGFPISKGSIIYPFDDDDIMMPLALQTGFDFLGSHPKVDWFYAFALHIDGLDRIHRFETWKTYEYKTPRQMFWALMYQNFIHGGTGMIRRSAIKKVGGWDPVLASQEFSMWLKLSHAGLKHALVREYLMYYRMHALSESAQNWKNGVWAGVKDWLRTKYGVTREQIEKEFKKLPKKDPIYF